MNDLYIFLNEMNHEWNFVTQHDPSVMKSIVI